LSSPPTPVSGETKYWKLAVILAPTAILGVLVILHVDGINGPDYWRWPWRVNRGLVPYFVLLAAAIPWAVGYFRFSLARASSAFPGLLLMMATVFGLELVDRGLDMSPFDLTRIGSIIEEPGSTGYFTHAEELVQSGQTIYDFLHNYPHLMPTFTLHARNKPPGSILFYVPFLRLANTWDGAALRAGLLIALLATLSVPATYLMVRELTGDRSAAFTSAACMALSPGLILFVPEFDQFYPAYSCALIILWARALGTGHIRYGMGFGLLFALICFQTFNLLVMGVFVAGYSVLFISGRLRLANSTDSRSRALHIVLRQTLAGGLTFAGFYLLLWLWCGFNPVQTLITGITNHSQDMPGTHRTWPRTILFDLTDFALGAGWITAVLAGYYCWLLRCPINQARRGIIFLCLLQPFSVGLVGLLQGETARVWLFMLPMLLLPAGLELSRWSRPSQITAFACMWFLMAVLSQNMVFV